MNIDIENVLRHIPEEIRNKIKEQSNYNEIIEEKIDIAQKYIIYGVLRYDEMPVLTEDIILAIELQSAIMVIENYTMIFPQVFGTETENNQIVLGLATRLRTLLNNIQQRRQNYTIIDGMGNNEDSFIFKHIIKSNIFKDE